MPRMSRRSLATPLDPARAALGAWVARAALVAVSVFLAGSTVSIAGAQAAKRCTTACDLGVGDRSRWRRIDVEAGLSDLRVRELEEASDGTLWVATDHGLNWYDGYTFHAADGPPKAAPSSLVALRDNELAAVFPDGLWRGGRAGWSRVELERIQFPNAPVGPVRVSKLRVTDGGELVLEARHPDGRMRAHAEDATGWRELAEEQPLVSRPSHFTDPHRGHMPFLTLEGGLLGVDGNGVDDTLWPMPEDWLVTAAFPDPGGLGALVAVALPWADRGVWMIGPESRERVPGTESEAVVALDTANDGVALVLLVGGMYVARAWDGVWRGPFRAPPELEAASIVRFLRSGDLVVGGRDGIAWLQRSRSAWDTVGLAHPTPASRLVLALLPTRSGELWVGTAAGLEHHATNQPVAPIEELDGERLRDITALAEDDQGRVWIGSGSGGIDGILVLDDGVVTRFADPTLPASVHAFVTDERHRIWVAGLPTKERPGGLWMYEHGRFERIDLPDPIHRRLRVYDVSFGANERIYVATSAGLFQVEDGRALQLLSLDSNRGGRVGTVCSDGSGGAWFGHGASAPGLGRVHADGRIEYIEPIDGRREPRILDLLCDAQGRLWVGDEDGLLVHDHGGLHRIDGRPLGVQALAVQEGRLLIGTRGNGVVRFDPSIAATFETRLDVAIDLVDRNTLVSGWTPRAYWSERPSTQLLTRHRLDDGVWSDWSLTRGTRVSGLASGEHTLAIELLGTPLLSTPQRIIRPITIGEPLWARLEVAAPLVSVLLLVLGLAAWSTMRWIGEARAHREATVRFEQLANNVRDVFWLVDWHTSEVLYVNPAHRSVAGLSNGAAQSPAAWRDRLHPDDRAWVIADYRDGIERCGEWDAEFRLVRPDGGITWVHARAFAIRDTNGTISRVAGIAEEVTERREAEVRQQRLSLELDHRVKNVLAQVAAIAEQTVARATDLPEFSRAFIGRVRSMARTHEALASNRWSGMPLHEVIETALGPTVGEERCTLTGPAIVLTPRASTSLGLVLHELGTNAVKYGALREPLGSIETTWHVDAGGVVVLTWIERGSTELRQPRGKGLGLSLVRGLIEHDLGGVVALRFEAHGLVVELTIPGVVVSGQGPVLAAAQRRTHNVSAEPDRATATPAALAASPSVGQG
jgi:PAS domain S-box-containing protein